MTLNTNTKHHQMTYKTIGSYFFFIHVWSYAFSTLWIAFFRVTTSCSLYWTWKPLKTFSWNSPSVQIIIGSRTELSVWLYVFFLSIFSFGFRATRFWTFSTYAAASVTFVYSISWKPNKIISWYFLYNLFFFFQLKQYIYNNRIIAIWSNK